MKTFPEELTLNFLEKKSAQWVIGTNALRYVGNRQIHEDFGINRELRLKVIWCGNPLIRQLARHVYQGLSEVPHGQQKRTDVRQASRGHPYKAAKSTHRAVPNTTRLPWLRFSVLFLSCKGINEEGHGPPTPDHGGLQPKCRRALSQSEHNSGFNSQISMQPNDELLFGIIPHRKQIRHC
jgi:hypothetical protein